MPRWKPVPEWQRTAFVWCVVVGLVSGLGAGAWFVYRAVSAAYRAVSAANHAEHTLHAMLLTLDLVDEYVRQHNGAWPRSWDDLEELPSREWAMGRWPEDADKVKKYVSVDFAADPDELAEQSQEDFDAIKPVAPHYPYKKYGAFQSLMETLRQNKPPDCAPPVP